MTSLDKTTQKERQDFFNVNTAVLKKMYKSSHTIIALCVIWSAALIVGTIAFLLLPLLVHPDPEKKDFMVFMLLFCLLPLYILYVPAIAGGLKRTGWGHAWGIGICIVMCFGFPIGTILGFIGLNAYNRKELFGKQGILHSDLKKEYIYRKKNNIE